jgi:hypothetical protein
MKAKIDLEKFICSYVKWNNIQDALKDQGLKCWNDQIVEIQQESEAERIRRQTLKVLNYYKNEEKSEGRIPTEIDECIAWLEKQGKSKWTDEDEENFRDIIGAIHRVAYQPTEDEEARIEYIKSLKQRIK